MRSRVLDEPGARPDVERLQFVRRAKDLGFTLNEISDLLNGEGLESTIDVAAVAHTKLRQLDDAVRALLAQRCRLRQLLQICNHGDGADCIALVFEPASPLPEPQRQMEKP